jgi:hypothetical protein
MEKVKILFYVIIAISFQVLLGQWTGQGQGGIAMLLFVTLMELDPNYSFTYLIGTEKRNKKHSSDKYFR